MKVFIQSFKNDDEIKKAFIKAIRAKRLDGMYFSTNACYASYSQKYNKDEFMYFGHLATDDFNLVVDQFNKFFKNIKIVMIKFFYYTSMTYEVKGANGWNRKTIYNLMSATKPRLKGEKGKITKNKRFPVYRLEFSDEYNERSRYWLGFCLAQFPRMFDPQYGFLNIPENPKDNQLIEMIINHSRSGYGHWINKSVPIKFLEVLDNPALMNSLEKQFKDNSGSTPWGSRLYNIIMKNDILRDFIGNVNNVNLEDEDDEDWDDEDWDDDEEEWDDED